MREVVVSVDGCTYKLYKPMIKKEEVRKMSKVKLKNIEVDEADILAAGFQRTPVKKPKKISKKIAGIEFTLSDPREGNETPWNLYLNQYYSAKQEAPLWSLTKEDIEQLIAFLQKGVKTFFDK